MVKVASCRVQGPEFNSDLGFHADLVSHWMVAWLSRLPLPMRDSQNPSMWVKAEDIDNNSLSHTLKWQAWFWLSLRSSSQGPHRLQSVQKFGHSKSYSIGTRPSSSQNESAVFPALIHEFHLSNQQKQSNSRGKMITITSENSLFLSDQTTDQSQMSNCKIPACISFPSLFDRDLA